MSKEKIKIGILGGDGRQAVLSSLLSDLDTECAVWAVPRDAAPRPDGPVRCGGWECAVNGAAAIILPLPVTFDGVRLNCRAADEGSKPGEYDVRLTEIIEKATKETLILAGKIPDSTMRFAAERGKRMRDYYESEEFQIKNAVPTAEGAIACAMDTLPVTLARAKAAVAGYGRIGRTLAGRLIRLGADVTCIARSRSDLSWAWVDGCRPLPLAEYQKRPAPFDVIFNTVPHVIFDVPVISSIDPRTLFIELASRSGGINADAAKERGIRIVRASSLPGKCSPFTAGEIMFDAVLTVLREEGVL